MAGTERMQKPLENRLTIVLFLKLKTIKQTSLLIVQHLEERDRML